MAEDSTGKEIDSSIDESQYKRTTEPVRGYTKKGREDRLEVMNAQLSAKGWIFQEVDEEVKDAVFLVPIEQVGSKKKIYIFAGLLVIALIILIIMAQV